MTTPSETEQQVFARRVAYYQEEDRKRKEHLRIEIEKCGEGKPFAVAVIKGVQILMDLEYAVERYDIIMPDMTRMGTSVAPALACVVLIYFIPMWLSPVFLTIVAICSLALPLFAIRFYGSGPVIKAFFVGLGMLAGWLLGILVLILAISLFKLVAYHDVKDIREIIMPALFEAPVAIAIGIGGLYANYSLVRDKMEGRF